MYAAYIIIYDYSSNSVTLNPLTSPLTVLTLYVTIIMSVIPMVILNSKAVKQTCKVTESFH